MAREITGSIQLNVAKGYQPYQLNSSFVIDMAAQGGPSPGGITATLEGNDVDLSEIDTPGVIVMINYDATNFVEWGIYDGVEFLALGEIGPGETQIWKMSRRLGLSYGTGTGTIDSGNTFRVKADTATCKMFVGVFEK